MIAAVKIAAKKGRPDTGAALFCIKKEGCDKLFDDCFGEECDNIPANVSAGDFE